MLNAAQIRDQLMQAHQLYGAGRLAEAEARYRQVLVVDPVNRDALQTLVAICLATRRADQAEEFLGRLAADYPAEPGYCESYANALARRGQIDAAVACYERLFRHKPRLADSRYNFALLLRHAGRYEEALAQYEKALALGVAHREEVFSNMSVVLSELNRHDEAQAALEKALACNRHYPPALYNLALLHEEHGRSDAARKLFQRILKREPDHTEALVRLAQGGQVAGPEDPVVSRLEAALASRREDDPARESLFYALGKAYDDCGLYDEAFDHYREANRYSRSRMGPYDRGAHQALVDRLVDPLANAWLERCEPVSDAPLVFICGMFRSGSTLLEQMLAAHPALTAGGEIAFFNDRLPLPDALAGLTEPALRRVGQGYLEYLERAFPGEARVINKRPENFLYLGLLCRLYPNARFLNTRRAPLDNCLSVYFQQLGKHFEYSNELLDIGHYYLQYRRLMTHWRQMFPANIIDVAYDELVKDPETILTTVLTFLGLDWDPACLDFHERDNRVRTASVWQVRQPLHAQSSGRWRNYGRYLSDLRGYLEAAGTAA